MGHAHHHILSPGRYVGAAEVEDDRSLFDLGRLLMGLQDLLGCDVDVVTEPGLRTRIRQRVLNEARPL